MRQEGPVSAGPAGPVFHLNLLCNVIQVLLSWLDLKFPLLQTGGGQERPQRDARAPQTCNCVGAASLGRKLISGLEAMPEAGPVLSACSDEGRAGEVMWEVAAEPGSKPRFLCWPGVTFFAHPHPLSFLPAQSPGSTRKDRLPWKVGLHPLLPPGGYEDIWQFNQGSGTTQSH